MKKLEKKQVQAYARKMAKRLDMSDTEVRVFVLDYSSDQDRRVAQVTCNRVHDDVMVELFSSFSTSSPEQQRETIIHELLHWHVDKLHRVAKTLAQCHPDHVPKDLLDQLDSVREGVITRMAKIIGPHMPKVPWAKGKK